MYWLAQYDDLGGSTGSAIGGIFFFLIFMALAFVAIAGMWKTFEKAGEPGWAAIIPIYNTYIILKIVGKPWWWLLLMLIPVVNLILIVLIYIDLAKAFGKGGGFAIGLVFLPFLFFPMLGFGKATYQGSVAEPA